MRKFLLKNLNNNTFSRLIEWEMVEQLMVGCYINVSYLIFFVKF
jgi:hypothetical protein